MAYGYVPQTRNHISGLTATLFTVSAGPANSTRLFFGDGWMDRQYIFNASSSAVFVTVDLGVARTVDTVAVLNHNLASLGSSRTIAVRGADDSAMTVNVVGPYTASVLSTSTRAKDTCIAFASALRRYWRFTFDWGAVSGILRVGELVAGQATTLTRGELDGSGESELYRVPTVQLANGGERGIGLAGPILERRLRFDDFSPTEMGFMRTLMRDVRGPATPVLWCEDWVANGAPTEAQQKCLFGTVSSADYVETFTNWRLSRPNELVLRSLGREVGA